MSRQRVKKDTDNDDNENEDLRNQRFSLFKPSTWLTCNPQTNEISETKASASQSDNRRLSCYNESAQLQV